VRGVHDRYVDVARELGLGEPAASRGYYPSGGLGLLVLILIILLLTGRL
jgi:hypothetical protein